MNNLLNRTHADLDNFLDITQSGVSGITPEERVAHNAAFNALASVIHARQRVGVDDATVRFAIEEIWARGWYKSMKSAKLEGHVATHRDKALASLRAVRRELRPFSWGVAALYGAGATLLGILVLK